MKMCSMFRTNEIDENMNYADLKAKNFYFVNSSRLNMIKDVKKYRIIANFSFYTNIFAVLTDRFLDQNRKWKEY